MQQILSKLRFYIVSTARLGTLLVCGNSQPSISIQASSVCGNASAANTSSGRMLAVPSRYERIVHFAVLAWENIAS